MSHYQNRSIWTTDHQTVEVVDQRYLPHQIVIVELKNTEEIFRAIREMWIRGAPLIGATAAFGYYYAIEEAQSQPDPKAYIQEKFDYLNSARPTAVNLAWALERQRAADQQQDWESRLQTAWQTALDIVEEDVAICHAIGQHGLEIIRALAAKHSDRPIQILTHCNAGRMATVAWGTATAPIYLAHEAGIPVHVWVDETRPRNQGARITAWELGQKGIPHTVITDNTGGLLMQQGQVDMCIVGTDRTTYKGDVANKIGTYLKALAAHDNDVPFYVALPSTTLDWTIAEGKDIPIETRSDREVTHIWGWDASSQSVKEVRLTPESSKGLNYGFDVTPAKYVTGLVTERGICQANEAEIRALFPEHAS